MQAIISGLVSTSRSLLFLDEKNASLFKVIRFSFLVN